MSRGYCAFLSRRLLVFTHDHIFLASPLASTAPVPALACLGPAIETDNIIYGSFVNDHKPDDFVTVHQSEGGCFVRTSTLTEEPGPWQIGGDASGKHRPLVRTRALTCEDEGVSRVHRGEQTAFALKQQEMQEIKDVHDKQIICLKTIKNITCGHTELLLAAQSPIFTITIVHHSILLISGQKTSSPVRSLDFWGGYYFCLAGVDAVVMYKRAVNGRLEELKTLHISLPEIGDSVRVTHIKVPALEWSNRLFDLLHQDLPHHLLLAGSANGGRCFIVKYDLCKCSYVSSAIIDTADAITCMNYGPYDNGPILLGFSGGEVIALDYYSLQLLFQLSVQPGDSVRCITYEPCSNLIVGTERAVYACSLTEHAETLCPELEKPLHLTVKHRE